MSAAERLAGPLLRLTARVLLDVPATEAADSVAAELAFARAPSPARYLTASRLLRGAERRRKLAALGRSFGDRRKEQGLDVLARGQPLSPALLAALGALPPDARNGRRLTLIAELLTAHGLIEARASGALRELHQTLGPLPRPSAADRRRKRHAG